MIAPLIGFSRLAARDLRGRSPRHGSPREHLDAAIAWLQRAHDATPDGGVSYGYSVRGGWRPSYIETSGYIAVTFLDLARRAEEPRFRRRAVEILDWLVRVQNQDGSYSNPRYSAARGIVFDTGQDLLGLVRGFEETAKEEYLASARRAADWLVRVADETGRWTRNTHNGIPHVYNTRTAWPLLELNRIRPDSEVERVARANLDWALSQERAGFFDQCAFEQGLPPFTHTVAYAIRGLLESGRLLKDERYLGVALRSAEAVRGCLGPEGFLPGRIDLQGRPRASYCCLTGNCQMAVIWADLYSRHDQAWAKEAACSALRYVMGLQDTRHADPAIRGGVQGSHPIWGGYAPLSFPNWAAKFFIDALLRCEAWL